MSTISTGPKIQTSLWFTGNAEQAVHFYTSIFPSSSITHVSRYTAAGQHEHKMEVGSVMSMTFTLHDQAFNAINGPPAFQFNQAISFTVLCEDQEEVDRYWEKLGDGGEVGGCGWLKGRFGVSWRVVPRRLEEMQENGDGEQRVRVAEAKARMGKFDIEGLEKAFSGT